MTTDAPSLHDAIKKDDAETVTAFLDGGVDVNARDERFPSYTLLTMAAFCRSANVVRVLFERGVHQTVLQKDFDEALGFAATSNNVAFLQMFLENGAQLLTPMNLQQSLQRAAWFKSYLTMSPLIEHGAVITTDHLFGASYAASSDYSEAALAERHAQTVGLILDHGIDINARDSNGKNTALMLSAQSGSLATVKLLIERGARINSKNERGKTALKMAMAAHHDHIVAFLLKAGAKP